MGYTSNRKSGRRRSSYGRGRTEIPLAVKVIAGIACILLVIWLAVGGWNLYQDLSKEYKRVSQIEYELLTKGYSNLLGSGDQTGDSDQTGNDNDTDGENLNHGNEGDFLTDPDPGNLYYYSKNMTAVQREAYDSVVQCIKENGMSAEVPITNADELFAFMCCVHFDHPELFWYDGAYTYRAGVDGYTVFPQYNCEGEELEKRKQEIESEAEAILEKVSNEQGEYAKIKAVFDYLIDSIDYVAGAPDNQNMYSALVKKETVCAGYARATQYLLQQLGIETIYVTGKMTDGVAHGWNIVKCNGKYYQVDTTHGDRYATDPEMASTMPESCIYNYFYLCCDDEQMLRNRTYDDFIKAPVCDSDDLDYFILNGMYYTAYGDDLINDMKETLRNGEKIWECKFENKEAYDTFKEENKNGLFTDLIKEYYKEEGITGSFTTWYMQDDTEYTVSCWYE